MKGLNRTQLKTIAIAAMVCDHIAWGFFDFFTVQAQVMHVIGRLTIPIMCYFIAEGYRKTSNLKKYIGRMVVFYLISVLPFYAFFHEIYEYRQNIILDLLLGLLVLAVLEDKKLKKLFKITLTALLFIVSAQVGGWPIFPILCVLLFYHIREPSRQQKWFCALVLVLVTFTITAALLNQQYHFSHYNWLWYEKIYLLGFVLALPFLRLYNGEKGGNSYSSVFFYLFYPLHLAILAILKAYGNASAIYYGYVGIHVLVIILAFALIITVARSRPSKSQAANLLLMAFAILYLFGFLMEITTTSLDAIRTAIKIEYFGECLLMISLTWFASEFYQVRIPFAVYVVEGIVSLITMFCMFSMEHNELFYTGMRMDTSGPYPRVDISYGIGFYLFVLYLGLICLSAIIYGFISLKTSDGVERIRIKYMIIGFFCPWISILLREIGLTGGYEITSLGILGIIFCVAISWIKYGYFDSVQLAGENVLDHGKEGIMVIGTNRRIMYCNHIISGLFAGAAVNSDAYSVDSLKDILEGSVRSVEVQDKIYEMRMEPLMESGFTQGYMLWAIEMTEHYNTLKAVQDVAHTDSLTGLNNRGFFRTCLTEYMLLMGTGSMLMLDLDNFKAVNDNLGHVVGDSVLVAIGSVIMEAVGSQHLSCRVGGDEFCLFFKGITDKNEMAVNAVSIIEGFQRELVDLNLSGRTAVSIGIATLEQPSQDADNEFLKLYGNSDKALYLAKNSGKGTYRFY